MRILAFDVGGTAIKSAIIDDDNIISEQKTSPSCTLSGNARVESILEIARSYENFDAVSVATTGQVDERERSILFRYGSDSTEGYPIGDLIEEVLKKPTFILNDCNAAALGEAHFGAGQGRDSFLCLTIGTGVGGAIIENKKLYTGSRGIAGEVGHLVTHKSGKLCRCGRRGCYEEYASTTALVRSAKKLYPDLQNAKELFEKERTREMSRLIRNWNDEIVAGLLSLTYVFNPKTIILGGGIMEREDMLDGVKARFYKTVIPTFADVEILSATLGNTAGLYGAAVYARQKLLEEN